jgi:hypothetical protein
MRALAPVAEQGAGALLVAQDRFFGSRREQLVGLATHHKLPAIYVEREFAKLGGLLSYGTNFTEAFRSERGLRSLVRRCTRNFRDWHETDMPLRSPDVRCWGMN